jgi:hypothetical protein
MGTRSLTFVYDDNKPILNMYRQFDGYLSGHGQELASFMNSFDEIVNGYSPGESRKVANGMGCFAAQMIAHFKNSVGGFYIYPVDSTDCWQDYEYHVYEDYIRVIKHGEEIFNGSWIEFDTLCDEETV